MKFDDLIETIDMLDAEAADEVIDWQMTASPAAQVQRGDTEIERCRRDIQAALAEDYRQLMLGEDWLIVNGPHGVRWSGVVSNPERPEDIQGLVPPRPPRITHVHELGLGDVIYLLIDPELFWQAEEDITQGLPTTSVTFRCAHEPPWSLTHYRISWETQGVHPDRYDALECAVHDEMRAANISGLLGRKPIGGGWEAQLGIKDGRVTAAVVRYER